MKNIFIAAIFLFSQIGMTAEKSNQNSKTKTKFSQAETKKKFQIEDLTFSGLLLTKDEFVHLSEQDKVIYIYSMMAMTQLLESAQQMQMGYQDKILTTQSENLKSEKYSKLFELIIPSAQANPLIGIVLRVGAAALPALRSVAMRFAAVAESGGAKAAQKLAERSGTISKEALQKLSGEAKVAAENVAKAKNALAKVGKRGSANVTAETEALLKASAELESKRLAFATAGATPKQFAVAIEGSGLKRMIVGTVKAAPALGAGYLAWTGADTLLVEKYGLSMNKFIDENISVPFSNWLAGTDLSGPAVLTEEKIKSMKAGDSSKAPEKECLFGGIQSKWVDFGDKGILCTRPAAASNENCKQEDGKFQCPNYGFNLASGSINGSLCIDTVKSENLTIRCVSTLKAVIEAKAATLDAEDAITDLRKNYGAVIAGLEGNIRMKKQDGETKSILEYCMADNVDQKNECGAIQEILAFLKTSDIKPIFETRVQLAAAKSETPAAGTPAGNTPADDAAAAGVKQ